MTANDVIVWIGTVAAVLSTLYAILNYNRSSKTAVAGNPASRPWLSSIIVCGFACMALGAVGLDYLDRHKMTLRVVKPVSRTTLKESGLTPKQFMALYQNMTPIEARDAVKPFLNELMHFQGTVPYPVQIEGIGYAVGINDEDGTSVECEFGPDFEARGRVLKSGDLISGTGVIRSFQNGNGIALTDCSP